MLTFTVTSTRQIGEASEQNPVPMIAELEEPMTIEEVRNRLSTSQSPFKSMKQLHRDDTLRYDAASNDPDQMKPLNILFTNNACIEVQITEGSSLRYKYWIGQGCIVFSEKPVLERPIGIYTHPGPVLTILKDSNPQFRSMKAQMIRFESNWMPEEIRRDLPELQSTGETGDYVVNTPQPPEGLSDFIKRLPSDFLERILDGFLFRLEHGPGTREAISTYSEYLKDDGSEILYIGLSDDSRVFSYKKKNGQLQEVGPVELGKYMKQIVIEDPNHDFLLRWKNGPIPAVSTDRNRVAEFMQLCNFYQ